MNYVLREQSLQELYENHLDVLFLMEKLAFVDFFLESADFLLQNAILNTILPIKSPFYD